MELTSVFEDGGRIPEKYTCDGDDVNPPLEINDIPEKTKSMVLIVEDPDASSKIWVHWVVWNIPPGTEVIEEDSSPEGAIQGLNDFGKKGYMGPCPPSGIHRYRFKIYALDKTLSLASLSEKKDVEKAMSSHIISQTVLTGVYSRGRMR
jgi:Raf kinase inhibitor-like YbhB/YbcL family protein